MRALVWHGKEDIRCDTVSDPRIEHPRDAIVQVTSCAICGSDLHLFHNFIPAMLPGDIMGHEMMGEVVEVGSGVNGHIKKGDRVVVPFFLGCGKCFFCKRGMWSACDNTNPKSYIGEAMLGEATAGVLGYSHMTGGFAGGLAALILIAVMPHAGEPARMRAPLALAIIAVGLGGSLALLAVVAQLVG